MTRNIHIPAPDWRSDLASTVLELEKLRTLRLGGTVPGYIFFQLKQIFQILETLGSARIEGNNTTLAEYVEQIIEDSNTADETGQEIENIEKAIAFIEDNTTHETRIDRAYISHLHKIITQGLTPPPKGEGSNYPGELRPHAVKISKSGHVPVDPMGLPDAFTAFIDFINADIREQDQLLMVAVAHHRFMYIHPFDNGNGRMGRLLTYAFLIKLGFNVKSGRIINPSSVFYTDRDKYYEMLGQADSLEDKDILAWCSYFLQGLKNQIDKIDNLLQRHYTQDNILLPSIKFALERQHITKEEYNILSFIVKSEAIAVKATDLEQIGITGTQRKSYTMKKMRDKNMVQPITKGGRVYTIHFANSYLLRGVIKTLNENGFVAEFLNQNS